MMTEADLGVLIEAKLRVHVRGMRPVHAMESSLGLGFGDPMPIESYCALLRILRRRINPGPTSDSNRHQLDELTEQQQDLCRQLHVGLGDIWSLAARPPPDEETAERNLAYGLTIAVQRYQDFFVSSEAWRQELAAIDRSERWLALAIAHEAAGRHYQANAALAAAQWLDLPAPAAARTAAAVAELVRTRDPALPDGLRGRPLPGFRGETAHRRHWLASDMKADGMLAVPSLIAYACDENFWVRARIYRSLGQQPMVAAVPVLAEGLLDPHPFARAQAARSLGWIAAPFAVDRLRQLAVDDPSPEVRRSARQAVERIGAYWVLYGEPRPDYPELPRWYFETARRLASAGLLGAAHEHLDFQHEPGVDRVAYDAFIRDLEPFSYACRAYLEYSSYFGEANQFEAAVACCDPARESDEMMALYAVSKHGQRVSRAADLVTAPGAIGWNARRALRALRLPRRTSDS
jgi:hypothetical protein